MALCQYVVFFFFKQKTAYEMCGRDWSSDVCSSDLDPVSQHVNQNLESTGNCSVENSLGNDADIPRKSKSAKKKFRLSNFILSDQKNHQSSKKHKHKKEKKDHESKTHIKLPSGNGPQYGDHNLKQKQPSREHKSSDHIKTAIHKVQSLDRKSLSHKKLADTKFHDSVRVEQKVGGSNKEAYMPEYH